MNTNVSKSSSIKKFSKRLIYSIIFSFFMHSVVALVLLSHEPEQLEVKKKPTFVRLVNPPAIKKKVERQKQIDYEIDQPRPKVMPNKPVKSDRKADRNQQVVKEQAPKGIDARDQTKLKSRPQRPLSSPKLSKPAKQSLAINKKRQPSPIKSKVAPKKTAKTIKKTVQQTAPLIPEAKPQPAPRQQQPQISADQLLPDKQILNQIASAKPGRYNKTKNRDDIEIGDTIWLNLQHDLLVSFFRRFHNQIEQVWNYPPEALKKELSGTLELFITVNNKGELLDVDLRRSSGSDLLDYEAIQAVYRAAPFGQLSKHYPHDKLNIRAHFRYILSGKYIYGR